MTECVRPVRRHVRDARHLGQKIGHVGPAWASVSKRNKSASVDCVPSICEDSTASLRAYM
jgi:hypothetical protein